MHWLEQYDRQVYGFLAVMAVYFLWMIHEALKAISKQIAQLIYHLKGWDARDLG